MCESRCVAMLVCSGGAHSVPVGCALVAKTQWAEFGSSICTTQFFWAQEIHSTSCESRCCIANRCVDNLHRARVGVVPHAYKFVTSCVGLGASSSQKLTCGNLLSRSCAAEDKSRRGCAIRCAIDSHVAPFRPVDCQRNMRSIRVLPAAGAG